ncbi:MAG: transposase [Spirochaetaceae bacterium]|nr:MAG: transposase [Spirochaetaceae bacterium]
MIRFGATYHVMARANRREFILRADEMKDLFIATVRRAKRKYNFRVINICIMSNHFHLMIEPDRTESLSRIMQWILSVFAVSYNREFSLEGHVWYDRFKSKVVSSLRQFMATFSYINENPVKAGIVAVAHQYPYGGVALVRDGPRRTIDSPDTLVALLFPEFQPVSLLL